MSLRRRIERSETLAALIASLAGRYLAFCAKTTDWTGEGLDELRSDLSNGPILLVTWHSRLMMAAVHWPVKDGPLSSLYNRSPIGRVAGALHRRMGLQPMEMSRKKSNLAASRTVLKRVRDGVSIGMAADGPFGPALVFKDAPLEWARITGMPIYGYAFATTKGRRLKSWDRMLLPYPFGKGAYVFTKFEGKIPRKPSDAETEALRAEITAFLLKTTASADRLAGVPEGP